MLNHLHYMMCNHCNATKLDSLPLQGAKMSSPHFFFEMSYQCDISVDITNANAMQICLESRFSNVHVTEILFSENRIWSPTHRQAERSAKVLALAAFAPFLAKARKV